MVRTKTKEKSLATLTKELDEVFSLFIRLRDADNQGTVTCFVTGERVWWRDADAAHFIDRGIMPTRWDEMNVHATTQYTNRYEDPFTHKDKYRAVMVLKYEQENVDALILVGKSMAKFTRHELIKKIEHYKIEVAKLRKLKGL